jgi:hypothetical protein
MERMRGEAEQLARSTLYFAYSLPKYSAAADIVVRAHRQPGGEVCSRRPLGKIAVDLTEQWQGDGFHSGNLRDVHSEQLVSLTSQVESVFGVAILLPPF